MKNVSLKNIQKDIVSGIIVALVSIPISMGYAQIAGLPAVYGLYCSILPVLIYGLVTSSPQFVFGVDATPAALVGGTLATLGIVSGSEEAKAVVPSITLVAALWLLIFFFIKAGRIVNYISTPVMGGFISGIGVTIILMQAAKLFGGNAGTGEAIKLLIHIAGEMKSFNLLSAMLGVGTVVIILVAKKFIPKFPMSVLLMVLGALATAIFHIDRLGVKLLPHVDKGLPGFSLPDMSVVFKNPSDIILLGLSVAGVVMAQTLLATNNYANKYGYKVSNNREILSYAAANAASAVIGGCPLNGSVSRTGIANQFGCKSQVMSITASLTMLLIVLFGTPVLEYLPVPILTGIVVAALIGITEFGLAVKLWKTNHTEFAIFVGAFLGVLLFGTIYGVVIGVILSFIAVIVKAVEPPRAFLGVITGQEGFYSLNRYRNVKKIKGAVIYRFNGALFFANINTFVDDIEKNLDDNTKWVIVDAGGVGSIDVTAVDRLMSLYKALEKKGIRFYITEHEHTLNDQLRELGAGELVEKGVVRRTIPLALRDAGLDNLILSRRGKKSRLFLARYMRTTKDLQKLSGLLVQMQTNGLRRWQQRWLMRLEVSRKMRRMLLLMLKSMLHGEESDSLMRMTCLSGLKCICLTIKNILILILMILRKELMSAVWLLRRSWHRLILTQSRCLKNTERKCLTD